LPGNKRGCQNRVGRPLKKRGKPASFQRGTPTGGKKKEGRYGATLELGFSKRALYSKRREEQKKHKVKKGRGRERFELKTSIFVLECPKMAGEKGSVSSFYRKKEKRGNGPSDIASAKANKRCKLKEGGMLVVAGKKGCNHPQRRKKGKRVW